MIDLGTYIEYELNEITQLVSYYNTLQEKIPHLKYILNFEQGYIELKCGLKTEGYPIQDFISCFNDIYEEWIDWYNKELNEELEENATSNGKR